MPYQAFEVNFAISTADIVIVTEWSPLLPERDGCMHPRFKVRYLSYCNLSFISFLDFLVSEQRNNLFDRYSV